MMFPHYGDHFVSHVSHEYSRAEFRALFHTLLFGGRRSPAVACWASDHWVASSNPLRGSFVINFASLTPASAWPSLA